MSFQDITSWALFVVQILGLIWGLRILFNAVFGIGFDKDGHVVGTKPVGRFILNVGDDIVDGAGKTVRAVHDIVQNTIGTPPTGGTDVTLKFGKARRAEKAAKAAKAAKSESKTQA